MKDSRYSRREAPETRRTWETDVCTAMRLRPETVHYEESEDRWHSQVNPGQVVSQREKTAGSCGARCDHPRPNLPC